MDEALKGKMLSLPVQKSLRVPLIQLWCSYAVLIAIIVTMKYGRASAALAS